MRNLMKLFFTACICVLWASCASTPPFALKDIEDPQSTGQLVFISTQPGDWYVITSPGVVEKMDKKGLGTGTAFFTATFPKEENNLHLKKNNAASLSLPAGNVHAYLYIFIANPNGGGQGYGYPFDLNVENGVTKYLKIEKEGTLLKSTVSPIEISQEDAQSILAECTSGYISIAGKGWTVQE